MRTSKNLIISSIFMWSVVIGSTESTGNLKISKFHRNRRQTGSERVKGCLLPSEIVNGSWAVVSPSSQNVYQPGDLVTPGTTIQIKCKKGYIVSTAAEEATFSLCNGNKGWTINNPKCIVPEICPPLYSSSTTSVSCTKNGNPISCKVPTEGTKAKFTCSSSYELSTINYLRECSAGSWDREKPNCEPVCGMKTNASKQLIVGGQKINKGYYPWSIAIYRQYNDTGINHICSGSLISDRIILTAAYCVATSQGEKKDKRLFRVAAGKYFRDYNHPNDTEAQYSEVEEIFVYDRYRGLTLDLVGDIAVIVTKQPFNTTQFIQRICVDWDPDSAYEARLLNKTGVVTGWGYEGASEKPAAVIKEIFVPYLAFDQCYDATPDSFKTYVREDKMCAGYLNEGIGVNDGDGGGGLAFQAPDKSNRFYLRGILSNAPHVNGKPLRYALYTKVSKYIPFILRIFNRYRIEN